ncbi:hypothetical protein K438DRAFT_1784408 [Mycena galopus ATCC 62051]|nr:hypothetical protein K438DRAFT_1784408 [Mycena galopus ATCC 62051]
MPGVCPTDFQLGEHLGDYEFVDNGFTFLQPHFIFLHYELTWCPARHRAHTHTAYERLWTIKQAETLKQEEFSAPRLLTLSPSPEPFEWTLRFYLNRRHTSGLKPVQTPKHHSPPFLIPLLSVYPSVCSLAAFQFDMPCIPPYYPCPSHESLNCHDRNAQCVYYAVFYGRVRGVYSNFWITRAQTEGYTDSLQKGFRTWNEAEDWWRARCLEKHGDICPEFEPVQFTLRVPSSTHPSSNPCSYGGPAHYPAAAAPVPTAAPVATPGPLLAPAPVIPTAAPSPFRTPNATTGSSSTASSMSPLMPSPVKTELASPTPTKREPTSPTLHLGGATRVTPWTRIQLTESGRLHPTQIATAEAARAFAAAPPVAAAAPRVAAAAPRVAAATPRVAAAVPNPVPTAVPAVPNPAPATVTATPRTCGNAANPGPAGPSVLVTPGADAPNRGAVTPPPPPPSRQRLSTGSKVSLCSTPRTRRLGRRGLDAWEAVCRGGRLGQGRRCLGARAARVVYYLFLYLLEMYLLCCTTLRSANKEA